MKAQSELGKEDQLSNGDIEPISTTKDKPKCFVIMPLADVPPYDPGHFDRVFTEIIQPACETAGFVAETAAESRESHKIVSHILRSIVSYDMAICDLSSNNANVFYELGIRQMAKMPVTIIKDDATPDKFDVRGFRYQMYSRSLRSDLVKKEISSISEALVQTYQNRDAITSEFLNDLSVSVQIEPRKVTVSEGEAILSQKLDMILSRVGNSYLQKEPTENFYKFRAVDGSPLFPGDFFKIRSFANSSKKIPYDTINLVSGISEKREEIVFHDEINEYAWVIFNAPAKIQSKEIEIEKIGPDEVKDNYPNSWANLLKQRAKDTTRIREY